MVPTEVTQDNILWWKEKGVCPLFGGYKINDQSNLCIHAPSKKICIFVKIETLTRWQD